MIPPNILINIPLTFLSERIILNAAETFSFDAPPPTSKKFAGSSPYNLIISIVAIAKPAPFTMHPILPSNFMYAKSCLLASISAGSSSFKSLNSKISGCLNIELSSKFILASRQSKSFSSVKINGLISTKFASVEINILYIDFINLIPCRDVFSSKLNILIIFLQSSSFISSIKSTFVVIIFSGFDFATSSISIPP